MEAHLRYRKDLSSSVFDRPKSARTVKKHIKDEDVPNENEDTITCGNTARTSRKKPRIDFIRRNIETAATSRSRLKRKVPISAKAAIIDAVHKPGSIPRYVSARKEAMLAERNTPKEARCPPGMRLLSDEEKLESMAVLTEQRAEIEEILGHAPLHIESHTLLRQHRQMEEQLGSIERSMEQLNRKYVFVPE
jgi:hypothetical protein